jgi:membrane protease YdiL (CAAX protease family)
MRAFIKRYPVLSFMGLALGYQLLIVLFSKAQMGEAHDLDEAPAAHMVFRFRVFGPLVFSVLLTWYIEGRAGLAKLFGAFAHWKVPAGWYAMAFGWKFAYTYIGAAVLLLLGSAAWPGWFIHDFWTGDHSKVGELLRNLPFIIGIALVEETAWMKYCVTRLQDRYSAFASCLITGTAWGLWYLPMLLIGEGVPDGYPWHMFMLSMISLTFLLGWTYNMTRSGTILLIMQIISNCAFLMIPVLPGLNDMRTEYINAFVLVNFATAVLLVLIYGWRELGARSRAKWSENGHAEADASAPALGTAVMI